VRHHGAAAATLAVLLGALWGAPAAGAARFEACGPTDPATHCARLSVPLDHSGQVPGTISLLVRSLRRKQSSKPRRGVLIGLAGGPGQSGADLLDDFAETYAPALTTRDLVMPDQRGTGHSDLLRCPGLEQAVARLKPAATRTEAPKCAQSLGARRAFFTTPDSVADLESIRLALGVKKLALAGVSYGTKVALAYAEAHPENVEFLILDSTVTPDGPDPFERSNLRRVPGVLRSLCIASACRGVTSDPVADLTSVLARLRAGRVRGTFYDTGGHAQTITLTPSGLLDSLYGGDVNPLLRAREPAAFRAFLRGDPAPLFRLVGMNRADGSFDDPRSLSTAVYFATSCEDIAYPWTRSDPPAQRLAEVRAAAQAIPESEFAPFRRADELASDSFSLCSEWPLARQPRFVAAGPLPDVPALVLAGREDLRTPLSDARAVAAEFPRGQLVVAQHSGHSVATSEGADCATTALKRFLAGKRAGVCRPSQIIGPTRIPPTRPSVFNYGYGIKLNRTLAAAGQTFADGYNEGLLTQDAAGGLRGGYLDIQSDAIVLHRFSVLDGYDLSARIGARGTLRLRVAGARAAAGFLDIPEQGNFATGRLGGRAVRVRLFDLAQAGALHLRPQPLGVRIP
jgi:pimeloyl-ACP methyl ester carboxylesterase